MTAIEWRRLRWPAFEDLWRYPFEDLMSLYPPDLNKGREGKDYMKYFSHHPTVIKHLEPLTEKPEEVDMDALIAVSTLLRKNGEIVDGSWNRKLTRSIVKYLKDRGVPPATISTFTNANIRERKGFASRRGYIKHRASQKGIKPSDEQMIQRNLRRKVEYARWKDFRKSPIVFSKSLTQDDNGERVEPHVVVERVQALGVANKFPSMSAYHKALKALMIQNGFSEAEATGAHGMIIREQHIQTSKNYAHRRRELSKSKGVANGTTHSTVTQSMTKQMGLWADEAEVIKVPYSEDWWKVENI